MRKMKLFKSVALTLAIVMGLSAPVPVANAEETATGSDAAAVTEEVEEQSNVELIGDNFYAIELTESAAGSMAEQSQSIDVNSSVSSVGATDWHLYGSEYLYSQLSAGEQSYMNLLYQVADTYMNTGENALDDPSISNYTLPGVSYNACGISKSRAVDLTYLFEYQNPQYYFMANSLYWGGGYIYVTVFDEFANGANRAAATSQVFSKVNTWVAQANGKSSILAKEKEAHDIVCNQIDYVDYDAPDSYQDMDQSVYSSVMWGRTVCAGYSKLFTMIESAMGIETIGVTSTTYGAEHAWNQVCLNGKWYNVDTTWDDEDSSWNYNYFNVTDSVLRSGDGGAHIPEAAYDGIRPACTDTYTGGFTATGIYVPASNQNGLLAGCTVDNPMGDTLQYSWFATDASGVWTKIQDWTTGNEWVNWKPNHYGDFVLLCKVRKQGDSSSEQTVDVAVAYHPYLKGICQMPNPNGPGYLIGIESYTNNNYRYEMLILDCTLYAQGLPAWVYQTGKCAVDGTCLWTTWNPQYGYYWTLFRIYDSKGNIIDEACYGFANAY